MNPSERKTLKLMKLVSFGTICLILVVLYILAQFQDKKSTISFVAGTQISLLEKDLILNIKSFPWASERFVKGLTNQKINYINYWAQWCEPCLTEIPHLKKMSEQNPNINLIFVNVDSKDNLDKAKNWWSSYGKNLKTYYAKYETNILKHTRGLPYHQIYDKKNDLVSHFAGNIEGKEAMINQLLDKLK